MRRTRLVPAAALTVLALLLGGCGSSEAGSAEDPQSGATSGATSSSSAAGQSSGDADLQVTVEGDQISPNAVQLEAAPGDTLTVEVQADRTGELHVHSRPEQYVEFEPGSTSTDLTFEAPGTVEIEEHESGAVVAFVDVS